MPFNLQEGLCHTQVYCTQSPWSCNSPLLTHTSTGDTQTQFLLSLCGVSGSGCTQGLFESSEHLWWAQGFLLALDVATLRVGLPEKSSKNWKKKNQEIQEPRGSELLQGVVMPPPGTTPYSILNVSNCSLGVLSLSLLKTTISSHLNFWRSRDVLKRSCAPTLPTNTNQQNYAKL